MNFLQIFKEQDGQWSGKRTSAWVALFFAFASAAYSTLHIPTGWFSFLPTIVFAAYASLMFLFTSWIDIQEILSTIKDIKNSK